MKFQKPVIVYNYPKGIKAFYMRLNDDSKTVAAMDVLVPKVGIFLSKILPSSAFGMVLLFTIVLCIFCCIHVHIFLLIFQVGELIGGSQREERYDVIHSRYEYCAA